MGLPSIAPRLVFPHQRTDAVSINTATRIFTLRFLRCLLLKPPFPHVTVHTRIQYCQRIVIVDHGRTIATGTLRELIDATVGSKRRVTLRLGQPLEYFPDAELAKDGRTIRRDMSDVASELPPVLNKLQAAHCPVEDIQIDAPSLHAVFIHLTGRELRE